MKRTLSLIVVVLVLVACVAGAAAVKFDFQRCLIDAYQWVSGMLTVGDRITPDPTDSDQVTVNLLKDWNWFEGCEGKFCRLSNGRYAVKAILMPEWYLAKVRSHVGDDGLKDAVLSQALTIAGGFTHWLDDQPKTVDERLGVGVAEEEPQPIVLAATLSLQGRLATVVMGGWNIVMEARKNGAEWKLEVIAFSRVASP